MHLDPYQKSFSDFLSDHKFKTFGTFTTKRPLSLPGARRLATNFARKIGAGETTSMFWTAEPFDAREGFHFHALINTFGTWSNTEMWDYWTNEKGFGRSQFVPVRKTREKNLVEDYCSKYISKKMADYDFYLNNMTCRTGIPDNPDYIKPYITDYEKDISSTRNTLK